MTAATPRSPAALGAPNHWISGRGCHDVADIPLPRLVGPAVVDVAPPPIVGGSGSPSRVLALVPRGA